MKQGQARRQASEMMGEAEEAHEEEDKQRRRREKKEETIERVQNETPR